MSGSGGGWFNLPRTSYGSAIERNRALAKRGQRWCPHCKAALPLAEFGVHGSRVWCKACQRQRQRASRDHRAGLRETEAAIERDPLAEARETMRAMRVAISGTDEAHPWYGPCDGLGVGGECSECQRILTAPTLRRDICAVCDLAAAGLALREACREHDEVARHGDCPVCAALDAFDAALAAALGPRQEQTDEHD